MCCLRIKTSQERKKISSHAHETGTWYLLRCSFQKFPMSTPVLSVAVPRTLKKGLQKTCMQSNAVTCGGDKKCIIGVIAHSKHH